MTKPFGYRGGNWEIKYGTCAWCGNTLSQDKIGQAHFCGDECAVEFAKIWAASGYRLMRHPTDRTAFMPSHPAPWEESCAETAINRLRGVKAS